MIANGWQPTLLADVLKQNSNTVSVQPEKTYRLLGVRLAGRGAFLREEKNGNQIQAPRLHPVQVGDFIYSRLFAWRGALGLVSAEFRGCYVSGEFPTFKIDTERVYPPFLKLHFSRPPIWEEVERFCTGTTKASRNRFKQEFFLAMKIPLPPFPGQQRIVAHIEELARRVEEARGLRLAAVQEAEAFIPSTLHEIFGLESDNWDGMPIPDAIAINDRQVNPTKPEYAGLPHISGENIQSTTCQLLPYRTAEEDEVKSGNYLFSPNTILYSKIRPYLQKAVFVDFQGVCSADIYPIKVTNDLLEPRFVMWSLVAPQFTDYANRLSGRTRMPKLNRKQLFAFTLSCPPKDEQRRIVAYLDGIQAKVEELRRLQAETQKELDALMPSILAKAFEGEL